jgi:TolB-like protein/tetratricopeptide (TPR) repeat protein
MSIVAELKRRNVIRVAAAYLVVGWLLTEVLTTILPTLGAPDWMSRAVILIFAFGFIPAVVLSWVYELTPEGIKREEDVHRDDSVTAKTGRKLDYVTVSAVVALVIFLALFGARQATDVAGESQSAAATASIAVLPFVNMSNDEDNEYFSDGLTETLLHMLTQVPELKVAARTSSFSFKGQNKTISEIADALDVAHVLEGSVQRVGDRVRITAQLIRADDGFHVWSETYDRTLDDIFGIQDEIAAKVGGALSVSLLGDASETPLAGVSTESADAYDLYLLALNERAKNSFGSLRAAEDLLKGALTIDPDFLDAKAALAGNYLRQAETGLRDPEQTRNDVVVIAEQVLVVRPNDVDALSAKIFVEAARAAQQTDGAAVDVAIDELETLALATPGNLNVIIYMSRFVQADDSERVLPLLLAYLERDPLSPVIHYELGNRYMLDGDTEAALASFERSLELEPAQPNAHVMIGFARLNEGDGLGFLQSFINAIEVDPQDHEVPGMIAAFLYNLGLVEEADDFRNRVMAIAPTSEIAYQINLLRAISAGDNESGDTVARRAIEDDVPNRRSAYASSVQYLLRSAIETGTLDNEFAYLEEKAPGLLNIESLTAPPKYRLAQFMALDAWYLTLPREELLQQIDKMRVLAESFGQQPMDNPDVQFFVFSLTGDTEAAVDVALEHIVNESVLAHAGWRQTLAQAQFRDVIADPRMKAALQRWEDEEAAIRERVRIYLADLSAVS